MTLKMTLTYNGEELSKYLFVTDGLDRQIISDRTNTTVKVGDSVGEKFLDTTRGMRKITIPFYINKNDPKSLQQIARILDVTEPKQLIFGDDPDWYYSAILDGSLAYTQLEREGSGTLTFIVPDGYAHATAPRVFKNYGTDKSKILFTNDSNTDVPVNVDVTMKGDNGFIGLGLNGNVVQVGQPTQVDGIVYDNSQYLVKGDPQPDPKTGEINKAGFQTVPKDQWQPLKQGTMSLHVIGGNQTDPLLTVDSWGNAPAKRTPVECTVTYKLPLDNVTRTEGAKNFSFGFDLDFNDAPNPSSSGQVVATVHRKDGTSLASMLLQDLYVGKLDYNIEGHVNDKKVYGYKPNVFKYTNTWNRYAIIKMGSQFTFNTFWENKTFNIPGMENEEGYYVSFSFLKWFPYATPYVYGMHNWNFKEHFVDVYSNIPNFFSNKDILSVNSTTDEITINGIKNWDSTDIGSEPLIAQRGENILGIVASDWVTGDKFPDVTVTMNERRI